jgi:hypothetical protein
VCVAEAAQRTSPAPGRRSRGPRVLCGLLSLLVAALPMTAAPAAAGQHQEATALASTAQGRPAQNGGTSTAGITITSVTPAAPSRNGSITIRGTVTNNGSSPIVDSSVSPRQGMPLSGRRAIDRAMAREGFDLAQDGSLIRDHSVDIDTVAPGRSRTFSLRVPVSELALNESGVYQLAVSLTGQTEEEQWDQLLGAGRTLLPWTADPDDFPAEAPTQLTVVWPLISTTHLSPQTDEEQTPLFTSDALLAEISPGGRLHELVTLGAELPVTWVIDPDLLASVDALAQDYQVRSPDGPITGQGQEVARAWLHELQQAVTGKEVVALPFADPDLASLAHRGKDVPGVLAQLTDATEMARVTVDTVLGVRASTDFAWPVQGAIDPDIVSVATAAGADTVIARSDSLRPTGSLAYTPTAVRPIGGGVTALVADTRLSKLFQGDMSRPGNVSRAHQLLLTHTLAIHGQDPERERSLVIAPQRMPTVSQVQAMATALRSLDEHGDWVRFIGLSEAAEATPDPAANSQVPPAGEYPKELREQELPAHAFQAVRTTRQTLAEFVVILTQPERVDTPFRNAIQREMSTSWRGRNSEAAQYRSSVQSQLDSLTQQVTLIPKTQITLSGRSATIPVTVQNDLLQDVEHLELRLTSSRRLGLEVSGPQSVSVGGGHSQSVKFTANARANGRTLLEAQLYTPDNKPYGEAIRFHVEVTSITSTVLMVIGVGLLLVALAGVRMYSQRKRAAARGENDDVDDESGDGADEGDAPGGDASPGARAEAPAGDETPDTGGASRGPTGGSEKLDREN